MSQPDIKACSPAIPPSGTPPAGDTAVMSKKLWDIQQSKPVVLSYYFMGGTQNQQAAVTNTITPDTIVTKTLDTWTQYANVVFDKTSDISSSDIRINFVSGNGSWSAIGVDARSFCIKDPDTGKTTSYNATMNLGWLADANPPSAEDASTILHEFGHALGMMHEHQSPARGERIHLKTLEVYRYYRPLLNYDDKLVKSQVIDTYDLAVVSNYSQLDLKSIMMYFMPASLNEEGIDIPVNLTLSKLDKAFITLNYPGNANCKISIYKALDDAGVTGPAVTDIVKATNNGDYPTARQKFIDYNQSVMKLNDVNKSFLGSVGGVSQENGILSKLPTFLDNPLLKAILKNIANQVMVQRAITADIGVPGTAQRDVLDSIGALITSPELAAA
ncbi:hypothetical protein VNI00_017786, partial [Paramarasmius palmivorus]